MKKFYTILLLVVIIFSIPFSCKDITSLESLFPLTPANIDANAGTWKPIVLTTNNQIGVPAPTVVTSDAYKAELASIKDIQSKLTKDQRNIIAYWSVGGVLRWNQFFRKLVAQFNLPPVSNADGSYSFADSENPLSNPQFPFSNPPYAARAYSYVSVAIYDALKAAWYYKDFYKAIRPNSPYEVDNTIRSLMPEVELPPYPSEEATMSGAAAEMLKVLFPVAVEEITKMAADQRNAALWSGKATASDITAGLNLGKSVASFITAAGTGRFRTDGMGAAIGTPALWKSLADDAILRGETPWISLDVPPRPPMLPFFGKVKPWNLSTAQIVAERPLPPPSTSSAEMAKEVEEVKLFSHNPTREQIAIVHKWADGASTYTPPGHWNDIAEEYIRDAKFSEVRAARAFAMLNMAIHDAGVACWDTKYFYFNPRPTQLDASIKTTTGIPNFPAYVSGHSTFSASAASVLSYLFPSSATDFNAMADEASNSRLYGAIHYRSDCKEGLNLGKRIAIYTLNFAQTDGAN